MAMPALTQSDSGLIDFNTPSVYRTGPFLISLRSNYAPLLRLRSELYPGTEADPADEIVDFHIAMRRPRLSRRWFRPNITFLLEDASPFEPYPLDHAFPLLEWGLNWCIATLGHQHLMLHSAVLEREGKGLILPALPGSGKSTLCAALAMRGWRMLSDEFGLIRPSTGELLPLPRAVPLKNESIDVIRNFDPAAHLGPVFPKTRKGTVSHMRPPQDALKRQRDPATPRWVVFPRYRAGMKPELTPITKPLAFNRLANNSFNYRLLGATGFRTLAAIIRGCDCYSYEYGDLESAIATLNDELFR